LSANSAALPSLSGNLSQGFPHFSPVAHKSGGRRPLPAHLERIEEVIEPAALACPSGACARVKIGEDVSERLDVVAPKFRVIVTRRPRYACTACRESVIQAPAPARLIEGGIATERLLAAIAVSKYADGLPLYRQETIFARERVELGRNLMAGWMGHVGFHLEPLAERLFELIRAWTESSPTRQPCRCLRPVGAERGLAICGHIRETTGPGAAPGRRLQRASIMKRNELHGYMRFHTQAPAYPLA
jgi:transposase